MYAVIQTGGKQYRVEPGKLLRIEKLEGDQGNEIVFDHVLLHADGDAVKIGTPTLAGAKVMAEIVDQDRDKKVIVFQFKRRKAIRKMRGHRQAFTAVRIKSIEA